jgi:hypothetical protein
MIASEKPFSLFLRRPRQYASQPHYHAVRQRNLSSFRMHRFLYFLIVVVMCYAQFLGMKAVVFMDVATIATHNGKTETIVTSRSPSRDTVLTIAFVVTITGCGDYPVHDGAAVLGYSIHQHSVRGPNGGKYDYELYVFHHPDAAECALPLAKLGYIVQERDTPVAIADIQNPGVRDHMPKSGCCGEKELIKFEAFTMVQYPVVVLLDVDTLLLQPLDRLVDFMLDTRKLPHQDDLMFVGKPATIGRNTNVTVPRQLDLLYSEDYGGAFDEEEPKGTQGGFLILRPNRTVYDDIVAIVKKGDHRYGGKGEAGWGGLTGYYMGSKYCCWVPVALVVVTIPFDCRRC